MSADTWVSIGITAELRERLREMTPPGVPVWRVIQDAFGEVEALRRRVAELEAGQLPVASREAEPLRFVRQGGPVTAGSRWLTGNPFPKDAA